MFSIKFVKNAVKAKKAKLKGHSRTSKLIIVFVIISLFAYTGLAMWVQIKSGIELSPTLTTCFYAFCTGELWLLASIKKSKINNGQKARAYDTEIENYKGEQQVSNDENRESKG
jgi:hypothetical protein